MARLIYYNLVWARHVWDQEIYQVIPSLFIEDQDGLKSGVYVRRPQDFGLDFQEH